MTSDDNDESGRSYVTPRGGAPIDRVELPAGQGRARKRTPVAGVPPLPLPPPPDQEAVPDYLEGETSAVIMLDPDHERRARRWARHQATKPPPVSRGDLYKIVIPIVIGLIMTGTGTAFTVWLKMRDEIRDKADRSVVERQFHELRLERAEALKAYPTKLEMEIRVDEIEDQLDIVERRQQTLHPEILNPGKKRP